MGYSEIYCHICGVSFNVHRGRTDKEPRSAAWGEDYEDFVWGFTRENCPEEGGCFFVQRDPSGNDSTTASSEPNKKFVPKLEPDRSTDNASDNALDNASDNASENASDDFDLLDTPEGWEHIGSPECGQPSAYNGHHISVEAMRGCRTLQCLVRKTEDWEPEPDDEPFEAQGKFFLSGLSEEMPSRDSGPASVFPTRHGEGEPNAENCSWDDDDSYAMPFHPTCLEIFKRASLHRYGVVDIECLTEWWALELDYDAFNDFPRHESVKRAQEQWWDHNKGDEFLAANPCFIPGFESLLTSTQHLTAHQHTQPELISTNVSASTAPADLFSLLPEEIRMMILIQLSFKDIANLRLASRTFLQLPKSLFHQLTLRNTPWLYEAWSSLPISFWATTKRSELESGEKALDPSAPHPATSVTLLSPTDTDWYSLQTQITRDWKTLPGLKNRRRIWDDCEEILNRVDAYRKEGKISPRDAVNIA